MTSFRPRPHTPTPASPSRLSSLSPRRQSLVDLLTRIGYGTIYDLPVRRGEPVIGPDLHVEQDLKLKGADEPPPPGGDYLLNEQVVTLMRVCDEVGDGVIRQIDVQARLPFRVRKRISAVA
ncbi:MAG: hypothetical protein K2Q20_07180 [Phycisphaerales bacterium]|nr:hypothetical protein [Phycisphaerales bacterium]